MTSSARRKRRVSYLGESALGENTGIEVSEMVMNKTSGCKSAGRGMGWDRPAQERIRSQAGQERRIRSSNQEDSHQQTRFSASTITDNDQLSTEFGHLGGYVLILNAEDEKEMQAQKTVKSGGQGTTTERQ